MKVFMQFALLSLVVSVMCQTSPVLAADDYQSTGVSTISDQKPAEPLPSIVEESSSAEQKSCCTECQDCCAQSCCSTWTFAYRLSSMFDSHTSYQFGTFPGAVPAYAPLSKLDFSLNSMWSGLQIGLQRPNWGVHFNWMTPIQQEINGSMSDYDWLTPTNPTHLDSLSISSERWNEGQMLELEGEFKWTDCFLGMPIEVWPLAGFRFQRFDITTYNGLQVVSDTGQTPPVGTVFPGNGITFNQQFYVGYFGAQLRRTLEITNLRPIDMTLQVDGGPAWGYNVDHHLLRSGDRFTMDTTQGGALHLALIGETALNCNWSVGLEFEYLEIRTTGTHQLVNVPLNQYDSTSNGVMVRSDQTSVTAFLRASF